MARLLTDCDSDHGHESAGSCAGCFEDFWNNYGLNANYLARNNDVLFMSGTQGNAFGCDDFHVLCPPGNTPYENVVYALPGDGSK